jgi:hypothetical protein
MEPTEKSKSYEPVFIIGVTLFAIQLFWVIVTKVVPQWYEISFISVISFAIELTVPVLCIYFVKDAKQRTILIVLIFLSAFLRMAQQYLVYL